MGIDLAKELERMRQLIKEIQEKEEEEKKRKKGREK